MSLSCHIAMCDGEKMSNPVLATELSEYQSEREVAVLKRKK